MLNKCLNNNYILGKEDSDVITAKLLYYTVLKIVTFLYFLHNFLCDIW